ncbi:MAG TPA: DUF1810 domain-containing protein [Paludibacter sp.]|nr:DUF1810 domain-containing protein [Paludibacter sp.]
MYSAFDLERFITAQEKQYPAALAEIKNGRKESHWMWFVFPQIDGLGLSSLSKKYAIKSRREAVAYLQHSVLGPRLTEITEALLGVEGRSAPEIMGSPDYLKLKSCMTLFALVSHEDSLFQRVLDKYFGGELDERTVDLLDE